MPTEENQNPQVPDQPPSPPAEPPTPPPPAPPEPPAPSDPEPAKTGAVITIPRSAMAALKREERERGRKAALEEMAANAKKLGYASVEDMMAAAKIAKKMRPRARTTEVKPVEQPPAPAGSHEELRRLNRARAREEKLRKAAEARSQALEVEMELRTVAVRAGVKDVDYAIELLRRETRKMSPEQLQAFNEVTYFEKDLKKSHPYLYGTTDTPAHTAPGADPDAPPPAPKAPTPPPGPQLDARKMSREEYQKALRDLKIKDPSLGV